MRHFIICSALCCATAITATAQETGSFTAICSVQGTEAQMQMNYTRYKDVTVWQDRDGTNSQTTDMGQWGPTHWEGVINTAFGQYRLTGENQFVEAWLVGGVYSDMITLELTQTSANSFTMRDYFNDGPVMPCQVTQQ
ncbi:MAG: hypothetical protein AAF331_12710 [Pseudomonadota bacterium]